MAATHRLVNLEIVEDAFEEVSPLGRVLSLNELMRLPAPEPLIEALVSHRSAVLMVGATGSNKTFAMVGLGCSVATGKRWLGHKVAVKGHVVFVVGEGAHGLAGRIGAWERHTGAKVPHRRVSFVLKPASLTEPAFWEKLTEHARDRKAVLVILDTFSSLAPDADETKDVATIMRRLSDLRADLEGTTVLVHHTGWGPQDRARGGSQFESTPTRCSSWRSSNRPTQAVWCRCAARRPRRKRPGGRSTCAARSSADLRCWKWSRETRPEGPR